MKFKSLVIAFQEDVACKDPYFMGFTFEGKNLVLKGEFFKSNMTPIGEDHKLGWGENTRYRSETLADLLLKDCLGQQAKPNLISQLSESLLRFQHGNGIAWLVWANDLMKWTSLPQYGIIPRVGFLSTLEDEILTIRFPVPGVTFNQVSRPKGVKDE
jgi:hypothetical protein